MNPYAPPRSPAPPSAPKKDGVAGPVLLAYGGFSVGQALFGVVDWYAPLLALLFSVAGLGFARGKRQRVLGVTLSVLATALCLFQFRDILLPADSF